MPGARLPDAAPKTLGGRELERPRLRPRIVVAVRRATTWLVVAGVFALALVATVDAVLGRGERRVPARQATTEAAEEGMEAAAAELAQMGVRGVLYVTERSRGGCRLVALRLPKLERATSLETRLCRVEVGPRGRVALWSQCRDGDIEVRTASGERFARRLSGCAPAWSPNGELTFVKATDLVALDRRCTNAGVTCFRAVLTARDFAREMRAAPRLPRGGGYSIREVGWMTPTRLVVLARRRAGLAHDFVAVFEAGRLRRAQLVTPGRLSHLDVSRRGGEVVARAERARAGFSGFFVWGRRGGFVAGRSLVFRADRAYARSPDGRWVASASVEGVYISPFDEADSPGHAVRIPVRTGDLAWG